MENLSLSNELRPLLFRLECARVLAIVLSDDKKEAEFVEQCDSAFGLILTKSEVLALSEELKAVSEQMVD